MEQLFLAYLNASVMTCWTVLVVLVLRQLCKRCPRRMVCFFWLPVAFRFLCPVSLPAPFSFFNLLRTNIKRDAYLVSVNRYAPSDIGMRETPQVSVGLGEVDTVLSTAIPTIETTYSANPEQVWTTMGTVVWVVGILVMLTWALVRYVLLVRKLRTAVPVAGREGVFCGEMVPTPFVLGILRPKIYLPLNMNETLTDTVLHHERAHLRYHDPLWKLIAWVVLTVNWYNPLCWLAAILFSRDMELRCDEAVLEQVDARTYSLALVALAVSRRFSPVAPLAFGESSVRSRVKHILKWKKPARWLGIAAAVVCVLLVPVFATDALVSPVQWTEMVTAEKMELASGILHEGDGTGTITLDTEQNEVLADILNQLREEDMSPSLLPKRSGKRYFGMKIHFYDLTNNAQILTYVDGAVYISSGQMLLGNMVMWKVDSPALTGYLEELFAAAEMESVRWSDISAVSVYTSPAKVHRYNAIPPALGDIFTDIKNVPEEQRSVIAFDIHEDSLLGELHVDIAQTNEHLALVTLMVLFEDTVVVRYMDHLPDATQEERTYFVFTDGEIASALLRYCDTLAGVGEPIVTSDGDAPVSIVAIQQVENAFYLQTDEVDYSKIPTIPLNSDHTLRLVLNTDEVLTVQEQYYEKWGNGSTYIDSTIHTLTKDAEGFYTLTIRERHPGKEESFILYIKQGDGWYVLKGVFQAEVEDSFATINGETLPIHGLDFTSGARFGEACFYGESEEPDLTKIPSVGVEGNCVLRLRLEAGETLTVEETYFTQGKAQVNSGSASINSEFVTPTTITHTLQADDDGLFSLPVKEHQPGTSECNVFSIPCAGGRYLFRVCFDKPLSATPIA